MNAQATNLKLERQTMKTPPMLREMNDREASYNSNKLAATLTSSKHNLKRISLNAELNEVTEEMPD